jgi:hypothetical protein
VCNPEGVKLLEAEPVVTPEVAPEPPRETPQERPPSQPEALPTCASCGAAMQEGQDWCLACGTAAPGRLGQRPGWRAATTVIALTAVLVLGALGASYAALTGDAKKAPTAPAALAQAQVTPPAAQPPAATPTTPAQTTPTTPSKPSTSTNKLPKVHAPKSGTSGGSPITPITPTPSTPTPSTPTPSSTTGSQGSTGVQNGTGTGSTTTPSTTTGQPPADTGPKAIELAGDAGKAYDPYGRAKASGVAERALDDDAATSWYVDPKDPAQLGIGYAVDLGRLQGIREIELQTPTPGFRIEVYATDETEPPPDILDTRWSHITNVSDVGTKDNGKQKVVLGAGTTKYRNLLLWFTQPPTDGARVRLTELQVLG